MADGQFEPPGDLLQMTGEVIARLITGDALAANKTIETILRLYGWNGLVTLIGGFCDTLIREQNGCQAVTVVPRFAVDGSAVAGPEDVCPEVAWTGRLVAARAMGDRDQYDALIFSLPDQRTMSRYLAALMECIAFTLQNRVEIRKLRHRSALAAGWEGAGMPDCEACVMHMFSAELANAVAAQVTRSGEDPETARDQLLSQFHQAGHQAPERRHG